MRAGEPPHIRELLNAALHRHQGGRYAEAELLYAQILQAHPRHADALHLRGVLAHQTGRLDEAVLHIGNAIAENPRVPAFHNNLGNALKAQGRLGEADVAYEHALSLDPGYFEAHYNRGLLRQAQGRLDEAIESYRKVLAHKPDHAEAYNNMGNTLQSQGKLTEAMAAYGRALQLRPGFAEAHNNRGNVLRAQGDAQGAIASYTQALAHDPMHAQALRNVGIVLSEQGRLEESAAALRRALALKPQDAASHCTLANTLVLQGHAAAAAACFGRALELKPDYAEAALGRAMAAIPVFSESAAQSDAASDDFGRALQELTVWNDEHPHRLGGAIGSHQPFYLAYRNADVGALLARYGDLASAAAADRRQPPQSRRARTDRLRIVIVSAQVRAHPVWDVILRGLIAHLDRQRFEIHVYHTAGLRDAETAWAQQRVDRFIQGPKPHAAWLEDIATDKPDILFYPEVGMNPATCALAALRLAPVQVASWGHPITTGLPTIDYYLSGALIEGPRGAQHYRERLVRLPGTGVCTDASTLRAQPWDAPQAPSDVVRFAICQQPMKFDPADDALLAHIARETGACEFWLPSPLNLPWAAARLRHRLAAVFRSAGLDPDAHLRVVPWLARERFLGFLDSMDVFLDCPAFSGYTTAWQAVHRGVPVVTLEGEFLRQRLAAGLLRQIGVTDGIADSRTSYVQSALRFARECRKPKGRKRRGELAAAASDKADGNVAAVRALERALLEAAAAS